MIRFLYFKEYNPAFGLRGETYPASITDSSIPVDSIKKIEFSQGECKSVIILKDSVERIRSTETVFELSYRINGEVGK